MRLAVDKDATNRKDAEERPRPQLTRHHMQRIFFSKPHLPVSKFNRSLRAKKYIKICGFDRLVSI